MFLISVEVDKAASILRNVMFIEMWATSRGCLGATPPRKLASDVRQSSGLRVRSHASRITLVEPWLKDGLWDLFKDFTAAGIPHAAAMMRRVPLKRSKSLQVRVRVWAESFGLGGSWVVIWVDGVECRRS